MSGEFSHYPDNEPLPKGAELEPQVIAQFKSAVERLTGTEQYEELSDNAAEISCWQWYWDVVTNSLIIVSREHHPNGSWKHDECTVAVYEQPERHNGNNSSQISRTYRLDLMRPQASSAETELTTYSQDTHREVFDPSNVEGLPNPQDIEMRALDRVKARAARSSRAQEQRQDGVHISQMPPVGTANQEFEDILKVLARLEPTDAIDENIVHTRPYRLEPEQE